jgi:mono/diheme cytochrome c family protein
MTQYSKNSNIPGWITILFSAVITGGIGYGLYYHGFSGKTYSEEFRALTGKEIVKAKVVIIPSPDADVISRGEETFMNICSACHGMELEGIVGPNLKDGQWFHPPASETNLVRLVMRGVPDGETKGPNKTPMPAKGGSDITDEQVWEVVYFLSSRNPSITKDSPARAR